MCSALGLSASLTCAIDATNGKEFHHSAPLFLLIFTALRVVGLCSFRPTLHVLVLPLRQKSDNFVGNDLRVYTNIAVIFIMLEVRRLKQRLSLATKVDRVVCDIASVSKLYRDFGGCVANRVDDL